MLKQLVIKKISFLQDLLDNLRDRLEAGTLEPLAASQKLEELARFIGDLDKPKEGGGHD